MAKKSFIVAKLTSIQSQRQQYKPYGYSLEPVDVQVEIEIPADTILDTQETDDGRTVTTLNMDGFKALLEITANAVDQVHDAYVVKARKAGKF